MKLLHRSRTVAVLLTAGLALLAWTGPTVPAMADSLTPPTHDADVLMSQLDTLAADGKAGQAQFWYVDTTVMKVSVYILASATDPVTAAFRAAATARPELATVELIDTAVEPLVGHDSLDVGSTSQQPRANTIYGGQKISLGGAYCTSGFNATEKGTGALVVVTAGHCAKVGRNGWHANGAVLGNITSYRYPGKDWSVITPVAGWSQPSAVKTSSGAIQQISAFANPRVNESVCKTGATTGSTCGTVTALNVTVNYGDGPVYGLAQTNVYSQPGDSGGSVYDKSTGVAMISGGTKDGKTVFVQPIQSL